MAINSVWTAPCYDTVREEWVDGEPEFPEGPIELYEPIEDGTEDLPVDANFEDEYRDEYPDMMSAIRDVAGDGKYGRFMWSRPDEGRYLGFLNHCPGSVALVIY